jgi:hypothetical protein
MGLTQRNPEDVTMPWTETALRTGRQFNTIALTRQVGGDLVSFTVSADNDPSRREYASQAILDINGSAAVSTTLLVRDKSCEAVIGWGPALGGGVLRMTWTLSPDGDGMRASGGGEWNGAPIEPFDTALPKAVPCGAAAQTGKAELVLADGTRADAGQADDATVRTLAAFAGMVGGSPELDPQRRDACVAACTAAAAACALACAALAGPAFAICGKGCVLAQSACIAGCVYGQERRLMSAGGTG